MRRVRARRRGGFAALPLAFLLAAPALRAAGQPEGRVTAAVRQLWDPPDDIASRDLFFGPGGRRSVPDPAALYRFEKLDRSGHSRGYEVEDPDGRRWKVKVGDEAQSELVVSRLLWAIGYHQPVMHYLPRWRMAGGPEPADRPGRFRLESDHEKSGTWRWTENPFTGTRPMRGLIVAEVLLNNWDLTADNNRIYTMKGRGAGPSRRYVVQDLGAALGRTRRPLGTRNILTDFESQDFIEEVREDEVRFDYHGPHQRLLEGITPADVLWTCRLLARLSDRQIADAFRAAHYPGDVSRRYIRKIREKIGEGLALARERGSPR